MDSKEEIVSKCKILLNAYSDGKLGYMKMPEDSSPVFLDNNLETRLVYFTLPMSLNYQRNSYKLWESVLETFNDNDTKCIFNIQYSAKLSEDKLMAYLLKYKIALQPNRHIAIWHKISKTISDNWGSIIKLLEFVDYDFLKLKNIIQKEFKKGFPYLSGPKIFNYWSFIIQKYCNIKLKNSEFIDIAPDTHVIKCSVILEVINKDESISLTREQISERWRTVLKDTGITPIDMHSPLWFWSRNNFKFKL
jgi:hypothetical protein